MVAKTMREGAMAEHGLLCISGSLRQGGCNRRLLAEAARLYGGAEVTFADLRLPLFDEDLETAEGLPDEVETLAGQIAAADAVLIATPEYNKALSGVLKNALDWVSRAKPNPWQGKPVALMAAAAGRSGGERALQSLVQCMLPFRPRLVYGPEVLVAQCGKAFDAEDRLCDEGAAKLLGALMQRLREAVEDGLRE